MKTKHFRGDSGEVEQMVGDLYEFLRKGRLVNWKDGWGSQLVLGEAKQRAELAKLANSLQAANESEHLQDSPVLRLKMEIE